MHADVCISDDQLARWAEGAASGEQVASMSAHLAGCQTCRTVLSELARTDSRRPDAPALGRYLLLEQVGAGGMGTVHAAWDPTLGRKVAVKILHEASPDGGSRTQRFLHERHILGGLEHPHIGRLLDAGETPQGRPYFVMEFVDGQPLDRYCDDRRLSLRQRLELMLPVFAAVTHAHQHLVVHRDLKPGNILVTRDGVPKLVDFGIARLLEEAAGLTVTGLAPMTPAYASPEQVRREAVGTPSDVYALGVVLYELLTGLPPYAVAPGDLGALLRAVREAEPRAPSLAVAGASDEAVARRAPSRERLRRALAGDLDAMVGMALRKEPQDRYPSVEALAADVRAWLEGRPTAARRGGTAYRALKFVRRHRTSVAALAAGFLALGVGLVATLWQAQLAARQRDLAQRRFEQVRTLAHSVLFDYHDGIAALAGSTPLRERLVKDALAYLDSLAAEATGDAALRRELAQAYLKVGDVQGDPFGASLGDTASARASYLKGRAEAEAAVALAPGDRAAGRAVASSHEKVGAILEVSGDLRGALAEYEEARRLDDALARAQPDDLDQRYAVSTDDLAQGQVLYQLGELQRSAVKQELALAERRALVALHPDVRSRRGVGAALLSVARLRRDQGQPAEATSAGEEAEQVMAALASENPDSPDLRRSLFIAWQLLADVLLEGSPGRAAGYARKAVQASTRELALDPENSVARRDHAASLQNLASALSDSGAVAEAAGVIPEALQLFRTLRDQDPANQQVQRDLCRTLSIAATNEARRGALASSEALLGEQLAVASRLLALDPENLDTQESLHEAHAGRARVAARRGRLDLALAEGRLALSTVEAMLARDPTLGRLRHRRAEALAAMAGYQLRLAELSPEPERRRALEAARQAHQQALEAIRRLEQDAPLTPAVAEARKGALSGLARCEQALATR